MPYIPGRREYTRNQRRLSPIIVDLFFNILFWNHLLWHEHKQYMQMYIHVQFVFDLSHLVIFYDTSPVWIHVAGG